MEFSASELTPDLKLPAGACVPPIWLTMAPHGAAQGSLAVQQAVAAPWVEASTAVWLCLQLQARASRTGGQAAELGRGEGKSQNTTTTTGVPVWPLHGS